jgi:transposase
MASLTKKIINGRPYYYLRETARVGGRSKVVKTTYLGRAEDLLAKLSQARGEPKAVQVRSFGAVGAALKVAHELDLVGAIDRACPAGGRGASVGELICLAAINRAICPRSKRQLADWHGRTALARLEPKPARALSSQRFWDAMDRLDEQAIASAEQAIVERAISRHEITLDTLVYDTTNFATFVDSANERNTIARRGHAKGGRRDLRLVGLALALALDGGVPLAHHAYEGNRPDAKEFPEALSLLAARLQALGVERSRLTLVFDKGNNSKANQALADELELKVVGSLVGAHHPELLECPRSRYRALEGIEGTSAHRTTKEIYGKQRTVLVTFSEEFAQKQQRSFAQTLSKARRQLRELKGIVERGRHRMDERKLDERLSEITAPRWISKVIVVKADLKASTFSFRTDQAALDRLRRREFGKRILFCDRPEWSDEQIVLAYRSQAEVEAAFRQMKDPDFAAFQPIFHWTDQKLRVHAFYCTLALMIVSLIARQLRAAGIELGPRLALRALSEIHETTLVYPAAGGRQGRPRTSTQLAEMDDTQRRMFDALGLADLAPAV